MKKVYLETPEAVIKALKEGKEVRDENNYSFKIVDGFIVATYDDDFYIGYTIASLDKPYILEEEPLKIECGKQYETRDHRKAFVFKYDENSRKFLVSVLNREHTFMVNEFGRYYDEDIRCELDLISEWKEDK